MNPGFYFGYYWLWRNGELVTIDYEGIEMTDYDQWFQITVRVTDQRVTQERIDTSTVVVNIQRDQFPPVFQRTPYSVSISDNQVLNTTIYTVTAVDSDLRVSGAGKVE